MTSQQNYLQACRLSKSGAIKRRKQLISREFTETQMQINHNVAILISLISCELYKIRNLHASFNMNSCLFRLKTVTVMHHWSEKQRFAVGVLCVTHALGFFFLPPLNKILMRRRLFSLMWPTDAGQINNDHFSLVKAAGRGPFVYSACDIKMCNHISGEGDLLE